MYCRLLCVSALVCAVAIPARAAIPQSSLILPLLWFDHLLNWPLLQQWFTPIAMLPLHEYLPDPPPLPPCRIEPLTELTDPEAIEFEENRSLQTHGLTPATAMALSRFEAIIESVGGTVRLTSAYRPAVYQAHLQEVWDKWMLELRDSYALECQDLRAEVAAEFFGHGLLETQRPASVSDHTRGTAFDAVVELPKLSRKARRRINTDTLARRAGLFRPVAIHDPVHFRLRNLRKKHGRVLRAGVATRRDHKS